MREYDSLADIYDLWCTTDPAFTLTHDYYVDLAYQYNGIVVELGVGTGRIAIDIAKKGKHVIGVDVSQQMLRQCSEKVTHDSLNGMVSLINSDVRAFKLKEKADLIIFPFRSIGHLLSYSEKKDALTNIYSQLKPNGRFVFDHYVFNMSWAENMNRVQRLMYSGKWQNNDHIYIWDTYIYDFDRQLMQCYITTEQSNKLNDIVSRKHHPLSFSWIYQHQMRELLTDVGFKIEALYGGFHNEAYSDISQNQVWIAVRP